MARVLNWLLTFKSRFDAWLLGCAAGGAAFALARWLRGKLAQDFDPVFLRIYAWESGYDFTLAALGLVLIVGALLARRYAGDGDLARRLRAAGVLWGAGAALLIVSFGAFSIARPLALNWQATPTPSAENPFWLPELERSVRETARAEERPILYYFHADWCAECPDFERYVLGNPLAGELLQEYVLVRVDLSEFDKWSGYVQQNYGVTVLPAAAIRDRHGRLLPQTVVGSSASVYRFLELLRAGLHAPGLALDAR